jgi:hypothetical protein
MRRIFVSALALGLFAVPSVAATVDLTCRDFARGMADEYMAGKLDRADAGDPVNDADRVLIIAPGRSYYMPRQQNTVMPSSFLKQRNLYVETYNEEYWRCMRGGDITINVDPSLVGN